MLIDRLWKIRLAGNWTGYLWTTL